MVGAYAVGILQQTSSRTLFAYLETSEARKPSGRLEHTRARIALRAVFITTRTQCRSARSDLKRVQKGYTERVNCKEYTVYRAHGREYTVEGALYRVH